LVKAGKPEGGRWLQNNGSRKPQDSDTKWKRDKIGKVPSLRR